MLDLEKELKRMSEAYNIPEKEVVKWFRGAVQTFWNGSVFFQDFVNSTAVQVENTNPRSMKRYPVVKRSKCASCGEMFGDGDIEVDHIKPVKGSLKSFEDCEKFFIDNFCVTPNDIQKLCKNKFSTKTVVVNGKKKTQKDVLKRVGCHEKKTYSEDNGCSLEHAEKVLTFNFYKRKGLIKDELEARGMVVPKTIKEQSATLLEAMLNEIKEEGK